MLPEFCDLEVHLTPEEKEQLGPWGRYRMGGGTGWSRAAGPFSGVGPRNYSQSDEQIYEDVCERMARDGQLDASDIEVEIKNREVTLTGQVPDRRAKRLARDISDSVPGVQDVHNRLRIGRKNQSSDRWVDEVGGSGM